MHVFKSYPVFLKTPCYELIFEISDSMVVVQHFALLKLFVILDTCVHFFVQKY